MKIKQARNRYSFFFEDRAEIMAFNDWVEEVGLPHAVVYLPDGAPTGRQLRRLLTKRPSILEAKDDEADRVLRTRWKIEEVAQP